MHQVSNNFLSFFIECGDIEKKKFGPILTPFYGNLYVVYMSYIT